MTVECCICHSEIRRIDDGTDQVSHGMHEGCAREFYGEDFADLLEGEPT